MLCYYIILYTIHIQYSIIQYTIDYTMLYNILGACTILYNVMLCYTVLVCYDLL